MHVEKGRGAWPLASAAVVIVQGSHGHDAVTWLGYLGHVMILYRSDLPAGNQFIQSTTTTQHNKQLPQLSTRTQPSKTSWLAPTSSLYSYLSIHQSGVHMALHWAISNLLYRLVCKSSRRKEPRIIRTACTRDYEYAGLSTSARKATRIFISIHSMTIFMVSRLMKTTLIFPAARPSQRNTSGLQDKARSDNSINFDISKKNHI